MAAQHRSALLLLSSANAVALAVGLALAHGTIALPQPGMPVGLVAEQAPAAPAPLMRRLPEPLRSGPAATRMPTATATSAPRAVIAGAVTISVPAPKPPRRIARSQVRQPSFESRLMQQVNRIPGYRPELVRWVVVPDLAVYAVTSLRKQTVYVSPRIPRSKLYSVAAHEWAHILSTAAYGNDLRVSQQAFLDWFGGGSMRRATERAADCMARLLGATWTHYTACRNDHWRWGARYLVVGWRLPTR